MYIEEYRNLAVDRMPAAIQDSCRHSIDKLIDFHHHRFGIDKDFYPINGIEQIRDGLASSKENSTITKKEFYQGMQYHDSWSVKKFRELWPDLVLLLDEHLPE